MHVVGEVARMRAGEAHPLQPGDVAAGAQQLAERERIAERAAVGVHVLAEQGDLDDAGVDQRAGSRPARRRVGGRSRVPRRLRHDAERAGVVAADRDRHPGAERRFAPGGSSDGKFCSASTISTCGLAVVPGALEQDRQAARLCVPKTTSTQGALSTIRPRSFCARQPPTAICIPGFGLLGRHQVTEVAVQPVVGVLAHGAGVEDDQVGARASAARCSRPPRAARPGARSRGRSSGTRRCGSRRSGP